MDRSHRRLRRPPRPRHSSTLMLRTVTLPLRTNRPHGAGRVEVPGPFVCDGRLLELGRDHRRVLLVDRERDPEVEPRDELGPVVARLEITAPLGLGEIERLESRADLPALIDDPRRHPPPAVGPFLGAEHQIRLRPIGRREVDRHRALLVIGSAREEEVTPICPAVDEEALAAHLDQARVADPPPLGVLGREARRKGVGGGDELEEARPRRRRRTSSSRFAAAIAGGAAFFAGRSPPGLSAIDAGLAIARPDASSSSTSSF